MLTDSIHFLMSKSSYNVDKLLAARGVEVVHPAGKRCSVIRVTELVVLSSVGEFMAHSFAELLPSVVFVDIPGQ